MQCRDFFVEVLRQHIDFLLIIHVILPKFDLRQHLVVNDALMTKLMTRRATEVYQPAFRQQDEFLAVGKFNFIDLRLDRVPFAQRGGLDFGSKWPMLRTMDRSFISRICSSVMTSILPVAVTKISYGARLLPW